MMILLPFSLPTFWGSLCAKMVVWQLYAKSISKIVVVLDLHNSIQSQKKKLVPYIKKKCKTHDTSQTTALFDRSQGKKKTMSQANFFIDIWAILRLIGVFAVMWQVLLLLVTTR